MGQVLGPAAHSYQKLHIGSQAGVPRPHRFDSSLQLPRPPTAFGLDVFTSKPGLLRVRVPGWWGKERLPMLASLLL